MELILNIEIIFRRMDSEKPLLNLNEDDKLKEMITFMYNYVQQKEKLDKDHQESDSSSPERSSKNQANSSCESHLSSPSLVSPRSNLSDSSLASHYGLLQMVSLSTVMQCRSKV